MAAQSILACTGDLLAAELVHVRLPTHVALTHVARASDVVYWRLRRAVNAGLPLSLDEQARLKPVLTKVGGEIVIAKREA